MNADRTPQQGGGDDGSDRVGDAATSGDGATGQDGGRTEPEPPPALDTRRIGWIVDNGETVLPRTPHDPDQGHIYDGACAVCRFADQPAARQAVVDALNETTPRPETQDGLRPAGPLARPDRPLHLRSRSRPAGGHDATSTGGRELTAELIVPTQGPGVGAWRQPRYYGRGVKLPLDPYHHQRARWAIIGIQRELIRLGHLEAPPQPLDGGFGPKTNAAVVAFQRASGIKADGLVGPATANLLFRDVFLWWETALIIPDHLAYGLCRMESALDPGAEGTVDNRDRGIAQFNRRWWPSISDEVAFSRPDLCVAIAADELRKAHADLGLWDAAVASHNSPSKAREWARTGRPPDTQIAGYVLRVRKAAGAWS